MVPIAGKMAKPEPIRNTDPARILFHDPRRRLPPLFHQPSLIALELVPGSRIQLLGAEFARKSNGEAMVVASTENKGRYRVRLDSGEEKLLRLDSERFRLLRWEKKLRLAGLQPRAALLRINAPHPRDMHAVASSVPYYHAVSVATIALVRAVLVFSYGTRLSMNELIMSACFSLT